MLINFNNFLRQTVIISRERIEKKPVYFFQSFSSKVYNRFSRWKKVIDSSFHSFLWLVFPFMVCLNVVTMYWVTLSTYCLPFFLFFCYSQIATIYRLISKLSSFIHFSDMLGRSRNEKVNCEYFGRQTTNRNIVRHKKRCSVEPLIALSVLISQQRLRLFSITT